MKKVLFILIAVVTVLLLSSARPQKLRLLYWNVQNGVWADQGNNYDNFVKFVKKHKPDICVWAEAGTIYYDGTSKVKPKSERYLPAHWNELAARYGHDYVYLGGFRDNYPQVITSKYPIEGVEAILGSSDTVVNHGAAWGRINVAGHSINVVALHTWPLKHHSSVHSQGEDARRESAVSHGGDLCRIGEVKYICNHTVLSSENGADELWMMMGDFNSFSRIDSFNYPGAEEKNPYCYAIHDYIAEKTPYLDICAETRRKFKATTFENTRIDYVYVTPALRKYVRKADIIWTKETKPVQDPTKTTRFWSPSDHLPIIVDFRLTDK